MAGWRKPLKGGSSSEPPRFGGGALESLCPSLAGLNIQDLSQVRGGGSLVSFNDPDLDVKAWLSGVISLPTPVCIWERRGNRWRGRADSRVGRREREHKQGEKERSHGL